MTPTIAQWKKCRLGDVASVISGFAFKSTEFCGSGVPVIKISNVRDRFIDLEDASCVDEKYLSLDTRFHVRHGDILMSLTGSHLSQPNSVVGRVARFTYKGTPCLLNQRAGKVTVRDARFCDTGFLFYLLCTAEKRREIALKAHGAANQANISPSQVESIELFIPHVKTQRKVSAILSAYDDLIENNTRRIAILEEMAQAIYREWFVNFRFPGHENIKLVESALGMIPEGWRIMDLGEAIEMRRGKNITRNTVVLGSVPVVAGGINPSCYHNESNTGSPVITVSASGANAGYVSLHHKPVWASDCSFIDSESTPNIYYLYSMFQDRRIEITGLQRGAAQPHVYPQDLMRLKVLDVPRELVNKFENDVTPGFRLIGNLLQRNDNLRKTRDLLLPKLISGQLDVEELDIDLGITAEEIGEPTAKPIEQKPTVRATAEIDSASTASTTSTSEPIPIDELDVDQVMAEFRQQARRLGTTTRAELLKAVSQELGYKRLGHNIEEVLKGHLRAAIRRKIIAADGEYVCLHTPSMETYERDELIDAFHSVMRKNLSYEREDVIRALANHLGFRRLTDSVREPIKSAINAAIRRGVLGYQGELIWRED